MNPHWPDFGDWLRPILASGVIGVAVWMAFRPRMAKTRGPVKDGPVREPYRIFTRAHDLELRACDVPEVLAIQTPDAERRRSVQEPAVWGHQIGVARALLAEIMERCEPLTAFRNRLGVDFRPEEWVMCLLVDQSGSMRDEPIVNVAASVRWISDRLGQIGVATGILGFSTVGWKGGNPRLDWLAQGRPARPGRLCALLHVVYQPIGDVLADRDWETLLHPDILCENIDGEAIEWAVGRLAARPEKHKLLIVISDGAPVDDSTIMENGISYLPHHIKQVVAATENRRDLLLGAVGIKYRVNELYSRSRVAEHLREVPATICDVIVEAVIHKLECE